MWSSSSTDDGGKMASILKVMASTLGVDEDDGREMPKDHGSSLVEEDDQGGNCKMPKDCGSFSVEEADKRGNRKMRKGRGSSSVEEADKGGEISLKKGPWTQAEDAILKEYVEKHGEGNWKAVKKNSGLARCGKSCRLRWANHLRPDLKKGAFTKEEEQRIFELHASMGNKWSKMAAELPGRTDNEIKNFWNTRMKRRQRAGLATYAKEVEIYRQVPNGNQENLNPNTALTNEVGQLDNVSQRMLSRLEQSTYSSQYNMSPMLHPSKRFRGSDMICNSLDPSVFPVFDQYGINRSDNITEHPSSLSLYDLIGCDQFGNDLTGSHADVNDNISTSSDPIYGAFKVELPSVRYFEARKRIWHTQESSFPPLAESVETPESSTQFQPTQSVPVSPQNNDGLLESVLYGYKNLNGSNNVDSFQENNVDSIDNGLTGSHADSNVSASFDPIYGAFKVELPSIQYFKPPKHIWHTHESLLPPLVVSVDTPESSTQFQPNQSLPVSPQNNDGYCSNNLNDSNNVDSFQENNDDCVLNEEVQNSTLNPSETQWDEQETLRSSLGHLFFYLVWQIMEH